MAALAAAAHANTIYTAVATDDSYVYRNPLDEAGSVDTNYGTAEEMLVRWATDARGTCKPYMRFELPDDVNFTSANLVSAKLILSGTNGSINNGKKPRVFGLLEGAEGWTEAGITWTNSVSSYANDAATKYYVDAGSDQITNDYTWPNGTRTIEVDLLGGTAIADAFVTFVFTSNTDDMISLMLGATGSMNIESTEGATAESDPNLAPTLVLEYTPEPATLSLLGLGALALLRRKR